MSNQPNQKKSKLKIILIVVGALFLLSLFIPNEETKNETTSTSDQSAQITQGQEETNQKANDIYAEGANLKDEKELALFSLNAWKTRVDLTKKSLFSHWDLYWTQTFNDFSQGKIDQYKAYGNLEKLTNLLSQYHIDFMDTGEDNHIYDGIKGEQLDKLKQAERDYGTAAYTMKSACNIAKEMFDNGKIKPSDIENLKKQVETAKAFIVKADLAVKDVEDVLSKK
ncbi:hypothetical protein [Succinivibrio dextrinosolvens]|uniref:Uncharacterized protein n=1 Tax=Succinivibrio dextrinosolvens TaxID=83771 RepID=A0A662Z5Y2_9GAMM|nr:hypothetical protein [Succinivibrio dextrinosolvens]SFJ74679.1 hypothetical protein SAMN04487865_1001136 [Succinivibrio dextrinosolvens]